MKKIVICGATGFTGQAMYKLWKQEYGLDIFQDIECVWHRRKASQNRARSIDDQDYQEIDWSDQSALQKMCEGAHSIVQLIGTVKKDFSAENDYEKADYGTTEKLLNLLDRTNCQNFVLLSSIGAGFGIGSYLHWKSRTEAIVRDSGVPYTVLRPSALAGDENNSTRAHLKSVTQIFRSMGGQFWNEGFSALAPIPIGVLAQCIWELAMSEGENRVYKGETLWQIASKYEKRRNRS